MAKRLATEYVNAKLQLTRDELTRLIRFFEQQQLSLQAKVFDNGNQELVLEDAGREEVKLIFERQQDLYVCELNCRLIHPKLTNAMRKAVSAFHGDAVVNRIYANFKMVYRYIDGLIYQIIEQTPDGQKIVFQYRDSVGQLERLYRSRVIEQEIGMVKGAINELLDLRNQSDNPAEIKGIDNRLNDLTHQLFILEA
ncbi:non-ribosomal peptide synthetase module [Paenibacillus protaetiae]|uniref:Non-ribosomal peptide synthetase module n=1 Tax=Paenibacillus protaetiae TaxID=2509456 RepID=A0A4P6ERT3_9BACL|nr:non-ribosomal peptide synthetase module [Paenibacillus protaetiae]QAY65145.1 non-ribosomal peptide synthetase module [Paenibacillus protaetiae]